MRVEFKNLKKELKSNQGNRVVLDVEEGWIEEGLRTGIIGANGAGKSILLNIIAGLEKATDGSLYFSSNGGDKTSELNHQDITLVFQSPYMMRTSVEKNIYYPMKIRGYAKADMEKRARELMEQFGLSHLKKEKAWLLSGGEKQKVALARALACKPKLLLLDEATANTDPAVTEEIEHILTAINEKERTTMVFITHNLAQAKRFCNQIVLLEDGKIVERGDTIEIMTSPKNEITKRFLEREMI